MKVKSASKGSLKNDDKMMGGPVSVRGSEMCLKCDILLTCVVWHKQIRLRGSDGIFRFRKKKMNSLRCLDSGYVKPTILDNQAMSRGGDASNINLKLWRQRLQK